MKFIDDLTVAESISLKEQLVNEDRKLAFPLNYHNRTGHYLPPNKSKMQSVLLNK